MTENNIPRRNSSALNIGIGILIGLIVALVVAALAMSGGPFRDKANTNELKPTTGSTDPNAPLYGNQTAPQLPPSPPTNDPAANEQGTGTGALMGGVAASGASGSSKKPNDSKNEVTTTDTPKAKASDDPIGDLITNKAKPAPETKPAAEKAKPAADTNKSNTNNAPAAPKTVAPKPTTTSTSATAAPKAIAPATPKTVTPKTVKPATAPTNSSSPKVVKPVTAP